MGTVTKAQIPAVDDLGRPLISDALKKQIDDAFKGVDGRGAILVIANEKGARAHFAAKYGKHWKVAAGGGWDWTGKAEGAIAIQRVW